MCRRCNGDGAESIGLQATILGREIEVDGVLTKTCETCDGTGTVTETRGRFIDELTTNQVNTLVQSDIYRTKLENGADEESQRKMERQQNQMQGGANMPTMNRGP